MLVQATVGEPGAVARFRTLAGYLGEAIGESVALVAEPHVLAHWQRVRSGSRADFVLDDAHFTDFRTKRHRYRVVAQVSEPVGFSVITAAHSLVIEPEDLHGRRLASVPAPSLPALRVLEVFPGAFKSPTLVAAATHRAALARVRTGDCFAAIVPSELVEGVVDLNVVLVTADAPGMGFSVAPSVSERVLEAVRDALLRLSTTRGRGSVLVNVGIRSFDPASDATYDGFARLLRDAWGAGGERGE